MDNRFGSVDYPFVPASGCGWEASSQTNKRIRMQRNFETLHAFVSDNYKGNPREEKLSEFTEYFESFTGFELIALRELLWMEIVRRTKQDFKDL